MFHAVNTHHSSGVGGEEGSVGGAPPSPPRPRSAPLRDALAQLKENRLPFIEGIQLFLSTDLCP